MEYLDISLPSLFTAFLFSVSVATTFFGGVSLGYDAEVRHRQTTANQVLHNPSKYGTRRLARAQASATDEETNFPRSFAIFAVGLLSWILIDMLLLPHSSFYASASWNDPSIADHPRARLGHFSFLPMGIAALIFAFPLKRTPKTFGVLAVSLFLFSSFGANVYTNNVGLVVVDEIEKAYEVTIPGESLTLRAIPLPFEKDNVVAPIIKNEHGREVLALIEGNNGEYRLWEQLMEDDVMFMLMDPTGSPDFQPYNGLVISCYNNSNGELEEC